MLRGSGIILLLIICLLFGTKANSQTYSYQHKIYTTNNGLLHNQARYVDRGTTNLKEEWNTRNDFTLVIPLLLTEPKIFWVFIILVILSIAGLVVNYFRKNYSRKQQIRETQLRLISAQNQISSHFISNCMNAIGSFLTTGEKAMANAYISEITHVMRHMVENIGREYIPFSLNLEILTRYLNAERIRMDMKFDYEILTADLNTEDLFIVPGMIQPFLGNSIRHGLPAGDEKKIKIILQFEPSTDKFITCIIQDNGKGWDESSKGNHNKLRASHGLQIIRERIRLYNELNKTKLTLSITNLYPDQEAKGTLVKINIPIKRERMK